MIVDLIGRMKVHLSLEEVVSAIGEARGIDEKKARISLLISSKLAPVFPSVLVKNIRINHNGAVAIVIANQSTDA